MNQSINRRHFIRQASVAVGGLTVLPSFAGKVAASDRLRVAHIGVGGMGNAHMKWFAGLPEVEIVALCDVDQLRLEKALKTTQEELQPGRKVDTYKDFRRVLDRQDIDAITCATPDHWHAQIGSMAFEAGKDVYGEKPLSYDVREGQMMLKSLRKNNRVFQLGTQIHAGDNYHRVVEVIRSGLIGPVHTVRLWKTGTPPNLGNPKPQKVPTTLDWDMWQGPAPQREYMAERCHFNYRYFMDYSGGVFADFWCHIADVVFWSLSPKGLSSVSARGDVSEGVGDTPQWIDIDYQFDGLQIHWTSKPPNVPGAADRGIGAFFEGEKGTLICDYGSMEVRIDGKVVDDLSGIAESVTRSPGHQQNFVDSVKSRDLSESHLVYAREMTLPMHLGLIAWRLGRPLEWNAKKEKFKGDKEANALLSRKPRAKWDLT
ncbi:MAG: Gfo/Idh/MocA family oxidoreductase [Bacteroidota bacterium]